MTKKALKLKKKQMTLLISRELKSGEKNCGFTIITLKFKSIDWR